MWKHRHLLFLHSFIQVFPLIRHLSADSHASGSDFVQDIHVVQIIREKKSHSIAEKLELCVYALCSVSLVFAACEHEVDRSTAAKINHE